MASNRLLSLLPILFALSGCIVRSTNPFFTEKDFIEDRSIVGPYDSERKIEYLGGKIYRETLTIKKDKVAGIDCTLSKLGDHFFLQRTFDKDALLKIDKDFAEDVFFQEQVDKKTFLVDKIMILGNSIYTSDLNEEWLKQQLKENPSFIKHKFAEALVTPKTGKPYWSNNLFLTDTSENLQALLVSAINTPGAWSSPTENRRRTGTIPISESGIASKQNRTFSYWWAATLLLKQKLDPRSNDPKIIAANCHSLSNDLNKLPLVGVDSAATAYAIDVAEKLKAIGDFILDDLTFKDRRALEAFVRGLSGDPFGVAKERIATENKLATALQDAVSRHNRVRASLTSKYEIEFP